MERDVLEFLGELEQSELVTRQARTTDNEQLVPSGQRPCPICQQRMVAESEVGFVVDVCPQHGVWLDAGELPAMLGRIRSGERINREQAIRRAKRDGKMSGVMLGSWSLLFD